MKNKVFRIIQIGDKSDFLSRFFDIFIAAVILSNIAVTFMETFDELAAAAPFFNVIELVTMIIFCIEYILRIWTADCLFPNVSKPKAVLKFIFSYDGIVDLLTILPFFFLSGFIVFRILRVVRIFRLFRINAQYDSFNVIKNVLKNKKKQIISSVFIIVVLMFSSSLGIYAAEHDAQPDVFSNAFSGLWWSMSTLLTVGYGDIYPITVIGKIMGIIIAFLGVGVVAIPTGIISAGFVEQYTKDENADRKFTELGRLGEILADEKSGLIGRTVCDIGIEYDTRILMIMRDDLTIMPNGSNIIKEGDVLIVNSEKLIRKHRKRK